MIITGNSNVSSFRQRGLIASAEEERVEVFWAGALKIEHFENGHPAGGKVRELFRNGDGWKLLSIGIHDIYELCEAAGRGRLEEALETAFKRYRRAFLEFNESGRFAWLVFPQPLHETSFPGISCRAMLDIARAFNKRVEDWCLVRKISVINPLRQIIGPGGEPHAGFLQKDGIHLNVQAAQLYLDEIEAVTGVKLAFQPGAPPFEPKNEPESFCSLLLSSLDIPSGGTMTARDLERALVDFVTDLLQKKGLELNIDAETELVDSGLMDSLGLVETYTFAANAIRMDLEFDVNLRDLDTIRKICAFLTARIERTDQEKNTLTFTDFLTSLRGVFADPAQRPAILEAERRIANMGNELTRAFIDNFSVVSGNMACGYGVIYFWLALIAAAKDDLDTARLLLAQAGSAERGFPFNPLHLEYYSSVWSKTGGKKEEISGANYSPPPDSGPVPQIGVITDRSNPARTIDTANSSLFARTARNREYLVSAIVSTYNAERFIRGKLEDLEAQTIAERIEIIVIDSGSLENERGVVEEFQRRYTNIRYIRTGQRETVYQAWNRGIKAATGKFITNANTDDRLRRDAIEIMVNTLLANPDKAMAYGDSIVTLVAHETFDRCTPHDYLRWPDFDRARLLDFCYLGPHPVWRREVHDAVGYFNEGYQCAADYEFWLRLAIKHEFVHIPELLGLYWQNEGTVSRKGELPIQEAAEIQQVYRKLYAELDESKNYFTFPHSPLAHKYCTGKGLEVGGAAHNPFGLDTLNVDFSDSMDTIYKQEEVRICGKAMPVDIVASGDNIPLPDESQDFVISSHVLEHFPNPVKALLEWDRLVKPGGTIFMIVPHKERTFDHVQPRTTLKHIIDDYYNNATEPHPNPQGHDHCWITEDMVQLCEWMIRELGVKWDMVEVQDVDDKVGNGFTIVIHKNGTRLFPAETVPAPLTTAPQSVLLVVHGFPPAAVGGVEVYTRNLALEMASGGIRVTVLYPVTGSSEPHYSFTSECVDGLKLVKFHMPRGHLFTSILSDEIDSAFGDFLRSNPFDFIHFHHLFDNLSMSMIDVAKKSNVPVAVTLHDFWFICPRAQLFIENNTSVCSGPESPAKCADCVDLAGWFPDINRADIERIIAFRHEYVRVLLADVDLLFAPSRFVADIFNRYGFGGGKIKVAPLGVEKFTVHRQSPAAGPRFGYMGTIHPVKNVLPLVRAFAATHGEASLHLYGGGEAYRVKELQDNASDPRITYHGSYTSRQLPEILAGIDVLVVPSLIESYCLTVREALSAGVPVLAARVGGIPEIVRDGVNGLLFDPFDNAELTRLLQHFISDATTIGKLDGNALPVMTIASDAGFLLAQYATVTHRPGLPQPSPEISSATNETLPEFAGSIPAGRTPLKIKVAVYSMDNQEHACGHYRIKAPLAAFANSVEIMWGISVKDNSHVINTDGIESADLIVVQRFLPRPDTREFLDYLCSLGKPVIFEIDDLLTELPAANPNHEWGMLGAPHIHDFMRRCAAVTVSTAELKDRFSPYNENIHVLPNMLDAGLWNKQSPPTSGPVVIGYAGTNTHGADLELLEEVLARIARHYGSEVSFTFMGCATERISRLPGFRFVRFETTYEAYARKLMEIPVDIMLAPLEDNQFNRCKSNVKWLEYSACGMAGIYSDLPPYACVKSGKTGLLVNNTADDWYNAISFLIDNTDKRRQMARNAREEVMAHYTVAGRASLYLDTYKQVLNAHRPTGRNIRFSIIIMTWNRAEMLDQCLKSLFASLSDPECCEVIVGNNSSTDHTEAVLGRYRIDKYLKRDQMNGLEFYRELFDLAEGEYIIDLDDDVLDLPRHFDKIFADYFSAFPDYGFLGLDVVQNRFTNGAKPESGDYAEETRNGRTVQQGRVIGCCACIRKETFERIGKFTGISLSMASVEDGVLTERVRKGGLKTGIIKDVKCFHACGPFYSGAYGYLDRDIEKYAMAGLDGFAASYRSFKEEKTLGTSNLISIIIPLYNKVEYTRQCLEALSCSTPSLLNYEVILVDNASTDGTPDYLRTLAGDVTIITNLANLGFARACNQGARLAMGDHVVFLNNDTIPKPGWLEALIEGIERDGADICGSRLLYPDGRVQHAGVAFNEQGIGYHIFNGFDGCDPAVTRKRFMQCVTAACMIVKKDIFARLGGFDEGYTNGFEDIDLCLRAGALGKRILYVPDSTLIHFEETSEGRKAHDEDNARRFLARWRGKVRCDDIDFYRREGYDREALPDGRIRVFKAERTQPASSSAGEYDSSVEQRLERVDGLVKEGKLSEALAGYQSILGIDANNHRAMTGIGVIRLLEGKRDEAGISFDRALRTTPDDPKALCGAGMVEAMKERYGAAFDCFSRALDSDPENLTALGELVKCAYRLELFTEAERHVANYLRYHPADLDMLFSLAGIQFRVGKSAEALDNIEKLLIFAPKYEGGQELKEKIEAMPGLNEAPAYQYQIAG